MLRTVSWGQTVCIDKIGGGRRGRERRERQRETERERLSYLDVLRPDQHTAVWCADEVHLTAVEREGGRERQC